jgi:hypothetical protein
MRQVMVIAGRELSEKRFVLFAAIAFAVLPFLIAAIPGARSTAGARDVVVMAAGFLCIGFTLAVALALGTNVIGRDLAENGLSFYFSRPVGAASVWFGKVAAALALIVASFIIVLLPARLAGAAKWNGTWGGNADELALGVLGIAVVLFFLAHVLGTFVRSRSSWIALDFVAFSVALIAGMAMFRSMIDAEALRLALWLGVVVGCGVLVAIVGGGAWQLSRGRTDRKRSHLALSRFVWSVIGATLAVAGAYILWVVSATPNDLTRLAITLPRPGGWIILSGDSPGRFDYRPSFTYNLSSGAYSRIARRNLWRADMTADGKKLVIARGDRRAGTEEIFERSIDRDDERTTGLTLHLFSSFASSANGDEIAAVDGNTLSVYDVRRKQSRAAVLLPQGLYNLAALYFVSPGTLRLLSLRQDSTLQIFDIDVDRRALQRTGVFRSALRNPSISGNEDGSLLIVRGTDLRPAVIDGRTAAVQRTLDVPGYRDARFLHDGRIAVSREANARSAVDIFDAGGKLARSIALPAANTWAMHEMRNGKLIVPARASGGSPWQTLIIDPGSGAIERIPATPLSTASWYEKDPRQAPIDVPSYYFAGGRLIRWNYATRQSEVVLPKG